MSFYGDHSVDDAENAVDIERPRPRPPRRAARPPAPGPAAVVLAFGGCNYNYFTLYYTFY